MGQKVNPTGLRLGVNRTWDSRWYADSDKYSEEHKDDHNKKPETIEDLMKTEDTEQE